MAQEITSSYKRFLQDLKTRIRAAQIKAALAVNAEMMLLYWQLGRDILQAQQSQGWGAKVIAQFSADLRRAFPEMKGFHRAICVLYPMIHKDNRSTAHFTR
jgi:hypothetical protein